MRTHIPTSDRPRSTPVTAATVALAVITVAITVAFLLPAAQPTAADLSAATTGPTGADQLPPPSGDAETDAALVRCAKAVERGHSADRYPPFSTWRSTKYERVGAAESELTVDDGFVCALTPDTAILSGTAAPGESGVRLVRMSRGKLVALDPHGDPFTIEVGGAKQDHADRVSVIRLDSGAAIEDVRLGVGGADVADVEPVPAQTVVDRGLPLRTPDTDGPDRRYIGECLARLPAATYTDPNLWMPFFRHDIGKAAPQALIAAIGDVALGYCIYDPVAGPTFVGAPPPAPSDRPQPVVAYHGHAAALLLTLPTNDGYRVEISPATGSGDAERCSLADHLAICTLSTPNGGAFVVTAFTAAAPRGIEVYQG